MTHLYESDEEIEKFEVTSDDLMNEIDPNRLQFKQTRDDAVYGIWADPERSGYRFFLLLQNINYIHSFQSLFNF